MRILEARVFISLRKYLSKGIIFGKMKRNTLLALGRELFGYPVFKNVNRVRSVPKKKRALLVYITEPFRQKNKKRGPFQQNILQARLIAELLGKHGFIVDVADFRAGTFRTGEKYDVAISHSVHAKDITHTTLPSTHLIYLATGRNHIVHNNSIKRRYEAMFHRRGVETIVRQLNSEDMTFLSLVHQIFGFGDHTTAATWANVFEGRISNFNNYGFPETTYIPKQSVAENARRNFLFFASGSQVGKGLDLLLEIFPKHRDLNLYICSSFETEPEFCSVYRRELFETPNIHPIGIIPPNGSEYTSLVSKCGFVVLPSCSDAQPGSVVQCMWSGLIPIVTRETAIDTGSFGLTFPDDSLQAVESTILDASSRSESWISGASERTREVAEQEYSRDRFIERWDAMLCGLSDNPIF